MSGGRGLPSSLQDALCILTATHQVLSDTPTLSWDNQKCLQALPDVPWGGKIVLSWEPLAKIGGSHT